MHAQSATGLDGDSITGDYISSIVGVRIATPLFGTGFNFCIGEPPSTMPGAGKHAGMHCGFSFCIGKPPSTILGARIHACIHWNSNLALLSILGAQTHACMQGSLFTWRSSCNCSLLQTQAVAWAAVPSQLAAVLRRSLL